MSKPKTRHNKRRTGNRRAHDALTALQTAVCTKCKAAIMPHRACQDCGTYNGRKVVKTDQAVEKALKKTSKSTKAVSASGGKDAQEA